MDEPAQPTTHMTRPELDDAMALSSFDALWLISFGGPEAPEQVVPFLQNVTRGQNIPVERLEVVGEHYYLFGGRSPINDQNRALINALEQELRGRGCAIPVMWGNRHWDPSIAQLVTESSRLGHRRVLMLTTSAYPSYSGCRAYREDVAAALSEIEADIEVVRVGLPGLDEGFIAANAAALAQARDALPGARVVFVTHSIPESMNKTSGANGGAYLDWHREVARRVLERAAPGAEHDLVFCSRSGRPSDPWLEPDVDTHLERLAEAGVTKVVLSPIGFISDHMEVIYDLDTQARGTCERVGIEMVRAATAGTDQEFVGALVDRVVRAAANAGDGCPDGGACGGVGCCPNIRRPDTPIIN